MTVFLLAKDHVDLYKRGMEGEGREKEIQVYGAFDELCKGCHLVIDRAPGFL